MRPCQTEAIAIFGPPEYGDVLFEGSMIKNPVLSQTARKNFNVCILGHQRTPEGVEEMAARGEWFRKNWM
jgi:hypothetical protein